MQNFSRAERIAAAIYFIWFFVHLGIFFYMEDSSDSPTGSALLSTYGISDFLLYIGVPLVLFIAYKIVFGNITDENYNNHRHPRTTFFISFLDEKIRAEELTQKINGLTDQPVSYDYLNELKKDREKAISQKLNNWLDRVEVKKKYKNFQS